MTKHIWSYKDYLKDGYPENRNVSGHHTLYGSLSKYCLWYWDADKRRWYFKTGRSFSPSEMVQNKWSYVRDEGQVIHPEIREELLFLLERLKEWERDNLTDASAREWLGHVSPSISRLSSMLGVD